MRMDTNDAEYLLGLIENTTRQDFPDAVIKDLLAVLTTVGKCRECGRIRQLDSYDCCYSGFPNCSAYGRSGGM